MPNTSVFGLGKVGITLASCLGVAGNSVIGVEIDPRIVAALQDGTYTTQEPGVMDRLGRTPPGQLAWTSDPRRAVLESELSFVIVPTPSNAMNGFSVRYVLEVCRQVGAAIREKPAAHTVSVVSTMLPGSSDSRVIPCLEEASGRKIGDGLGYCYNPSFIALGEIVKGIECPDYVLIGESDAASGQTVRAAHQTMIRAEAPIVHMSPVEAEITKIASNTHETMRVSFANMLLSICNEVPGANVDRITQALAHRMGKRFFKGAAPYGGPCWPRDNLALMSFMDAIKVPSRLPHAVHLFNEEHAQFVLRKVLSVARAGDTVGILGLAYKCGTPSIDRSFAVELAASLAREGRRVTGWDPLAMPEAGRELGRSIELCDSGDSCLEHASVVVIANPLPELAAMDWSRARAAAVIDCWRCLSPEAIARIGRYLPLGQGPSESVAAWVKRRIGDDYDLLSD